MSQFESMTQNLTSFRIISLCLFAILLSFSLLLIPPAGNTRFKRLIEFSAPFYEAASSKLGKTKVIAAVVDKIRRDSPHGGGFVKQDSTRGRWFEIGDDKARDKVGHAIRKFLPGVKKSSALKGAAGRCRGDSPASACGGDSNVSSRQSQKVQELASLLDVFETKLEGKRESRVPSLSPKLIAGGNTVASRGAFAASPISGASSAAPSLMARNERLDSLVMPSFVFERGADAAVNSGSVAQKQLETRSDGEDTKEPRANEPPKGMMGTFALERWNDTRIERATSGVGRAGMPFWTSKSPRYGVLKNYSVDSAACLSLSDAGTIELHQQLVSPFSSNPLPPNLTAGDEFFLPSSSMSHEPQAEPLRAADDTNRTISGLASIEQNLIQLQQQQQQLEMMGRYSIGSNSYYFDHQFGPFARTDLQGRSCIWSISGMNSQQDPSAVVRSQSSVLPPNHVLPRSDAHELWPSFSSSTSQPRISVGAAAGTPTGDSRGASHEWNHNHSEIARIQLLNNQNNFATSPHGFVSGGLPQSYHSMTLNGNNYLEPILDQGLNGFHQPEWNDNENVVDAMYNIFGSGVGNSQGGL